MKQSISLPGVTDSGIQHITLDSRVRVLMRALLVIAVLGYYMPWVDNPGAVLSPGAGDLAEWITLHPIQSALTTSLLLRLPFVCVVLLAGLYIPLPRFTSGWIAYAVVMFALWATLLPPLDFFTDAGARQNSNFQQQFMLLVIALIGGAVGLSGLLDRWRYWLTLPVATMGIVCALVGLSQAYTLLVGFDLSVMVGPGSVVMTIALGAILMLSGLVVWLRAKQGSVTAQVTPP